MRVARGRLSVPYPRISYVSTHTCPPRARLSTYARSNACRPRASRRHDDAQQQTRHEQQTRRAYDGGKKRQRPSSDSGTTRIQIAGEQRTHTAHAHMTTRILPRIQVGPDDAHVVCSVGLLACAAAAAAADVRRRRCPTHLSRVPFQYAHCLVAK